MGAEVGREAADFFFSFFLSQQVNQWERKYIRTILNFIGCVLQVPFTIFNLLKLWPFESTQLVGLTLTKKKTIADLNNNK